MFINYLLAIVIILLVNLCILVNCLVAQFKIAKLGKASNTNKVNTKVNITINYKEDKELLAKVRNEVDSYKEVHTLRKIVSNIKTTIDSKESFKEKVLVKLALNLRNENLQECHSMFPCNSKEQILVEVLIAKSPLLNNNKYHFQYSSNCCSYNSDSTNQSFSIKIYFNNMTVENLDITN